MKCDGWWCVYILHGEHESIGRFHCCWNGEVRVRDVRQLTARQNANSVTQIATTTDWNAYALLFHILSGAVRMAFGVVLNIATTTMASRLEESFISMDRSEKLKSWMKSSAHQEENSLRHFVLFGKRSRNDGSHIMNWHTIIYWNCSASKSDRSNDKCTTSTIIQFVFHQIPNTELFSISIGVLCLPFTWFSCFCFVPNEKGSNRSLYFEQKNSISGEQNKHPLHWIRESLGITRSPQNTKNMTMTWYNEQDMHPLIRAHHAASYTLFTAWNCVKMAKRCHKTNANSFACKNKWILSVFRWEINHIEWTRWLRVHGSPRQGSSVVV